MVSTAKWALRMLTFIHDFLREAFHELEIGVQATQALALALGCRNSKGHRHKKYTSQY